MRAFDSLYQVDGQPLLTPDAGVDLTVSDIDSAAAGRDAAGYLHRAVLRSGMRTWGFTYSTLTAEEVQYMLNLFAGKPTFRFTWEGGVTQCYCAKQELTLYDRQKGIYKGLKFSIIQC